MAGTLWRIRHPFKLVPPVQVVKMPQAPTLPAPPAQEIVIRIVVDVRRDGR